MTKQLTDSERDYLIEYWFTEPLNNRHAMPDDFKQGFSAGLSHNQTRIDELESQLTAIKEELRITKRALNNG